MNDDKKQKRNKPCENCRAHRRKCKVTQGNQCDRCIKMNLACVFKFTAKPTVIKKNVPVSKKNKMLDEVHVLEQTVAEMEEQLQQLQVEMDLQPVKPTTTRQLKKIKLDQTTEDDQWQLTISHNEHGLSFQTSIQSVSDIFTFLNKTLRCFSTPDYYYLHTPNYHIDRSLQQITITNRNLIVEEVMHSFFHQQQEQQQDLKKPLSLCWNQDDVDARMRFKLQMIDAYFNCLARTTPTFSIPWFRPMFLADPNSMVASAMAAFITHTNCSHVVNIPPTMTREGLAESFRQEAREQLQEVLLEEEPSIFTAATLFYLAQSGFVVLENKESKLYLHLAWQMVLELRTKYLPIEITSPVTLEMATAESFRRLFYTIRYLEININIIYDDLTDYSVFLHDYGIGLPVVLENEKYDEAISNSIDMYRYMVILHVFQMSGRSDNLKFQLFAGTLESINVLDIAQIENQLFHFWKALPPKYRVSDSPLEYVPMERVKRIENPYAIYVNQVYYSYWLMLQTRMMRTPSSTDLTGVNLDRFDGERALLIVSIGCDAIAKLSHILYSRLPCTIELHWLLIACDALALLRKSQNARIRERAKKNLQMTLNVLEKRLQQQTADDDTETCHSMDTTELTSSSSTSSSAESEVSYFGEFRKALYTYFDKE